MGGGEDDPDHHGRQQQLESEHGSPLGEGGASGAPPRAALTAVGPDIAVADHQSGGFEVGDELGREWLELADADSGIGPRGGRRRADRGRDLGLGRKDVGVSHLVIELVGRRPGRDLWPYRVAPQRHGDKSAFSASI